jgi:D-beta-D-heptose 7-phosphate kinase/D-beta-D-heptose 1-phosphate adenosyltransferase
MSVTVIGDVMIDEFVYGDVQRISPEAATPILKIKRTERNIGGAGNVARGIAALNTDCSLVGVVGANREGIADLFTDSRLTPQLVVDPTRPTTVKRRYVSEQHSSHLLRVDTEVAERITYSEALRGLGVRAWHEIDDPATKVVVLSDYCKGVFSPMFAEMLVRLARTAGKWVIVDTKGDVGQFGGAHILKLNMTELGFPFGAPDDSAVETAAHRLAARHRFDHVVVTRGEGGLSAYSTQHAPLHVPGKRVRVRDVSGAGDTVVATLAAMLADGCDFEHALQRANTAAAIAVGKPGTSVVTFAELCGDRIAPADDWSLLRQRLAEWKGKSIGFTNGCFDMLHPGHVHLLKEASHCCDKLIVGLNSDASVRGLKGVGRPIQPAEDRARMLAALDEVALVVIFDKPTPEQLVKAIRPAVIFKGDDYTLHNIAGSEYAKNTILIPLRDGLSTTDTIKKIQEKVS